jgi:hypothetical protein
MTVRCREILDATALCEARSFGMSRLNRPSWLGAGAAAALVVTLAVVGVGRAAPPAGGTPASLVSIVPCRLIDTRAASQIGPRGEPLGPDTTVTFPVRGSNGNCTIPSEAVGIVTNTTAVNPTAASYLTVYPAGSERPTASNLNYLPTSPPTPNQVTVGLSADGALNIYNLAGSIDVIVDIVGYTVAAAAPAPTTTPTPTLPTVLQDEEGVKRFHEPGGEGWATLAVGDRDVPAGKYLVSYTVVVVNFTGTSDLFRCGIYNYAGDVYFGLTTARVGPNADVTPFHGEAIVTISAPGQPGAGPIQVWCWHDSQLPVLGNPPAAYTETSVMTVMPIA